MLERLPDDAGWMCAEKLGRGSRWLWGVSHGHSTRALGQWGEWIELRHLLRLRWDVLARNWKGRTGEVDLIAYDGPWLVLVEVKTRRVPSRLPPEVNVDFRKERKLERLAYEFTSRHALSEVAIRFDVIGVETQDQLHYCRAITFADCLWYGPVRERNFQSGPRGTHS